MAVKMVFVVDLVSTHRVAQSAVFVDTASLSEESVLLRCLLGAAVRKLKCGSIQVCHTPLCVSLNAGRDGRSKWDRLLAQLV